MMTRSQHLASLQYQALRDYQRHGNAAHNAPLAHFGAILPADKHQVGFGEMKRAAGQERESNRLGFGQGQDIGHVCAIAANARDAHRRYLRVWKDCAPSFHKPVTIASGFVPLRTVKAADFAVAA